MTNRPEPLSFTDPAVEARTYIDAMSASLTAEWSHELTLNDAIVILHRTGYKPIFIDRYIDETYRQTQEFVKCHLKKSL